MYSVTRLENDLTVATAAMPHMASVSVGIWCGVGSRYEPADVNGVCHFLEHLLFKGTRKRSARDISQAVEGLGGYLNAFTSEEFTCFHARAGAECFGELLDVLIDMFLNSKLAPADIAKERDVIKEEVAMYLDQPHHHVQELLNAALWPDQPLGRPITGTDESLDRINREELVGCLRNRYVTGSTVVVAAGRIEHRQVLKAAKRYAGRFQRGPRPGCAPVCIRQSAPRVTLFTKATEQTQIALGIHTCSRHDERRHTLRLLNAILGENMSSRLFQIVREDLGLAYSIYSTPSFFDDTGDLVISVGLDTEQVNKTLKLIVRELRRLTQAPPSSGELRRARDYVIGQMELGLESTENQMNWVGEQYLAYGNIVRPETIKRRLLRVAPGDILSAARTFLRPDRFNLALVSPLKSDRHLRQTLARF